MHHGILATKLVKNGSLTFDYEDNGSPISFEEAWGQFRVEDSSVYSNVYKLVSPLLLLVVFIFHLLACVLLQKMFATAITYGTPLLKITLSLMQGMHSFFAPPLHLDWEEIYRNTKSKIDIKNCWRR